MLRLPGEGLISTAVGVGGGGGFTPRPISHTQGKITLTIHELTYENRFFFIFDESQNNYLIGDAFY